MRLLYGSQIPGDQLLPLPHALNHDEIHMPNNGVAYLKSSFAKTDKWHCENQQNLVISSLWKCTFND